MTIFKPCSIRSCPGFSDYVITMITLSSHVGLTFIMHVILYQNLKSTAWSPRGQWYSRNQHASPRKHNNKTCVNGLRLTRLMLNGLHHFLFVLWPGKKKLLRYAAKQWKLYMLNRRIIEACDKIIANNRNNETKYWRTLKK